MHIRFNIANANISFINALNGLSRAASGAFTLICDIFTEHPTTREIFAQPHAHWLFNGLRTCGVSDNCTGDDVTNQNYIQPF